MRLMMKTLIIATLFLSVPVPSPFVFAAVDTSPRDTLPAPPGTDIAAFYYRHYSGNDHYSSGRKVSSSADFDGNVVTTRYLHYEKIERFPYMLDFLIPIGSLDLKFGPHDDQSNGLGDATAHFVLWSPDLIGKSDNKFWTGLSFYLTVPTGDYHSEKIINLSENRWQFKAEWAPWIWRYKQFSTEGLVNVNFYTRNDEYTAANLHQDKDPVYGFESHISYDVTKKFWLGLSYIHLEGGKTKVNGIKNDDETRTTTLKFSANMHITPNWSALAQYVTDVKQENGLARNYFQIRLCYAW